MATMTERLAFLISANADQAIREFQKTGNAAEKELGRATKSLDKVAGNLTKFGAGAMAFAGVAGAGLWKLGEGAAELEASTAALNQVLGQTVATNVAQWAKNGATEVGLSERKIIAASTAFGSLGKVAGYAGTELEEFTKRQVRLASDMAAFADVSPEQTIQDLRAAYAGSSETLQKYNVFVNDANIKQAIFAATGEKLSGVLTSKQRVMGIDLLLMEQTVDMQGQWARESGSLAGQQATLKAELENLRDGIGAGVLPVMNTLVGGLAKVAGGFTKLNPELQKGIGTATAFGTAAIGLAGSLSFLAGQAIKMRQRFVGLDGQLTNLGKAAKYGGMTLVTVGAAMAGVSIITSAFKKEQQEATQRTEEFVTALQAEAEGLDDATEKHIAAIATGIDFYKTYSGIGVSMSDLASVIKGETVPAYDNFVKRATELIRASGSNAAALKALEEEYGVTAAEARELIRVVDQQSVAYSNAVSKIDDTTRAENELTGATEDGSEAAGDNADATNEQSEALDELREKIEAARKAENDLLDAQVAAIDSRFAYKKQVDDTVDALGEWEKVNGDVKTSEEDKAEALEKATDEVWAQAGSALKLAEDWAETNDVTLTAKERQRLLQDELLRVAATLDPNDPLRANILGLAEDIEEIPEDWETEITADTSQAEAEIDGHLKYLDRQEPVAREKAKAIGEATGEGVANGIQAKEAFIRRTMGEFLDSVLAESRSRLDIRSPSRVMAEEVGEPIVEGIAEGVTDGAVLVEDALDDVGDRISTRAGEIVQMSIDEIDDVLDAAEDAFDEVLGLIDERRDQEEAAKRVRDAEEDLAEAEKELQQALQESGIESDEYRRAQERLEDAQENLRDANYRLLQVSYDLIEQGPAGAAMFENIARAAGLTRDEISKLITKYQELAAAQQAAEQAEAIQGPINDAANEATNQLNYQAEMDSAISSYQQKLADLTKLVQAGQSTAAVENEMAALAIKASQAYGSVQGASPGTSPYYKAQLDLLRYLVSNQPFLLDNLSSYVKAIEAAVPGYATGGIVTQPTLAMVGEKGPEAIIPLSKMGASAPMVVNIHVNGADPNQVVDALKRYARQNGAIPVRTMNP